MFRRTAVRHFSSLSRSQFRLRSNPHTLPNGTPITFYRVRFKKPPVLTWKRATNTFLYTAPLAALWYYVIPVVIDISLDDEAEEEVVGEDGSADVEKTGVEGDDDEEVDEGLFIPFGWPRQQPKSFYKGSDPEWQEFIKFAKDPSKHKDVQIRLVSAIRSEIAQHPNSKRVLGDVDINKGKFWLEITFPDGPPQEYELSGLEITDDFIAWSTKTVTQREYQKLSRAVFPTAAIWASWASIRYQFDMQINKVREYFGFQPRLDPEIEFIRAQLHRKPPPNPRITTSTKPDSVSAQSPAGASKSTAKQHSPSPTGTRKLDSSLTPPADEQSVGFPKLPSIIPQPENKPVTLAIFLHNLQKGRKPYRVDPPRGSIVVTGLIEVVGTRGRTTIDVSAAFDPQSNEYIVWGWRPRRIQPKSQSPKGGP